MLEKTMFANIHSLPWEDGGQGRGAFRVKYLKKDPVTGSYTAYIDLPAGWQGTLTTPQENAREWLLLDGGWTMADGQSYEAGAYYQGPPGTQHPTVVSSSIGCKVITWMTATGASAS